MIRIGIIGSGKIVKKFLTQVQTCKDIKISCMYSRTLTTAQDFAKTYQIEHSTNDMKTMIEHIDAVYIASPNGLHFSQAKFFLENNIHVLVEKTITFTVQEAQQLITLAKNKSLILLEAFISVHLPIFTQLKTLVDKTQPRIINLNFNRTSSRMSDVEKGIYISVFDKELGKGSTYDALIYPLQLVLYLVGKIINVKAVTNKLPNGVSISNHVILTHKNNTITTINCSKGVTSYAPSEFIGDDSSIILDTVHPLKQIKYYTKNGIKIINDDANSIASMTFEILEFVKMIKQKDFISRDY